MQNHLPRLIKNVLLWPTLIISLSGCASFSLFDKPVQPIEIKTKAEERTKLDLPALEPLSLNPPKWVIIHEENAVEVWSKLKEDGSDPVLFGLTDDNYQLLSIMIAELRNFINTQRIVIEQYKKYYEQQQ